MKKIVLVLLCLSFCVACFFSCNIDIPGVDIDIDLGKLGKQEELVIPNLVGLVYSESSTYVDGVTVRKEDVVYEYHESVEKGKIIAQSPAPGVVLPGVDSIDVVLTVSLGPKMRDFAIPAEHRSDLETAETYIRNNYSYVQIYGQRVAPKPVAGATSGSVVGALRVTPNEEEELSIDNGQIYKNKGEKIILLYQP